MQSLRFHALRRGSICAVKRIPRRKSLHWRHSTVREANLAGAVQCLQVMYTTESLNHLRTLNWLDKERRLLTAGSTAAALVEQQQTATRERMSPSLVSFHDRYAKRGQPSVVPLSGSSCSGCHLKLPSGVLSELAAPGRYAMCPNCSVVGWSGEKPIVELPTPTVKKAGRNKTYA
jgi:hypothetical protein